MQIIIIYSLVNLLTRMYKAGNFLKAETFCDPALNFGMTMDVSTCQ